MFIPNYDFIEAKDYAFEELAEIVGSIAAEYGMLKAYLFGFKAPGDNRPTATMISALLHLKGRDCSGWMVSTADSKSLSDQRSMSSAKGHER